jgi:3-dehydroquinate dehydratase type I
MTEICVSLIEKNLADTIAAANEAKSKGANIIELRLDFIDDIQLESIFDELLDLKNEVSLPFIITIRPDYEGGLFSEDEDMRIQLLHHVIARGFDFIDLEFSMEVDQRDHLISEAKEHGVKTIISSHNFTTATTKEVILERLDACHKVQGDMVKVVCPTNTIDHVNDVLWAAGEARKKEYSYSVMGFGPYGHVTRILAPYTGCEFVYCSIKDSRESAEGQVSISTLKGIWSSLGI